MKSFGAAALVVLMLCLGSATAIRTATPSPAPVAPKPAAKPQPMAMSTATPPAAAAAPAAPKAQLPGKLLRIGCIVPLSGAKANTGRAVQAAIQMAVRDLAADRLPGYNVTLDCQDTKCSDVPALWGGIKLARSNVDVMVGEVCSAASLGALGAINKYQVPLVSPASTSPALSIPDDYFFRTVPTDRYQGQYAARKMLSLGAKKVVIASTSDSYGQELAYNFIAAFTKYGGKAFGEEVPAQQAVKNGSVVLQAVRDNGADGVFIATNDIVWAADIIKSLRTAKPPVNAIIFGGDSIMDPTVAVTAGKSLIRGVRGSDVSDGSPQFKAQFEAFVRGKNISYVSKAAHAYDAAEALIEAFRRAPEPKDGPQIIKELANVRFQGVSGPIAFDDTGDLKVDPEKLPYTVAEFDAAGNIVAAKQ